MGRILNISESYLVNSLNKKNIFFIFIFPVFIALSLWRYSDVLFSDSYSLANSGDGIGTITGIFAVKEQITEVDSSYLFSDKLYFERHGGTLSEPGPFSQFWKIIDVIVGSLMSPNTAYDFVGMIGFLSVCISSYFLFRHLHVNHILSFLLALSVASIDNTLIRSTSHLFGLGIIFAPILVVLLTAKAANDPTKKNIIILALAHSLNLNVNEYYGYFGVFFTITFLIVAWIMNFKRLHIFDVLKSCCFGVIVFIVSMLILYPTVIAQPLINNFGIGSVVTTSSSTHVHDWSSFVIFSVRNIYSIFAPENSLLVKALNPSLFGNDLWEMSYRIGFVIPLLTVVLLYSLYLIDVREGIEISKKLVVWIVPGVVMFLFSLNPEIKGSLVPLTYKIAPMFRVATRSLLYFDIICFVMLAIVSSRLINKIRECNKFKQTYKSLITILLSLSLGLLVYTDVSKINFFGKMPALKLPDIEVYKILEDKPDGVLIELPYLSPKSSTPEAGYPYLYNRTAHKKPIANLIYTGSNNVKYRDDIDSFAAKVNKLDSYVINSMVKDGLRYIVIKNKDKDNLKLLKSMDLLNELATDNVTTIFNVRDKYIIDEPIDIKEFVRRQILDGKLSK